MKFLGFVLLLVTWRAYGFDWPVLEIDVTATFCEHRGDHFHTGIDLAGGGQNVYPIAAGEIIFTHREREYSSVPVGLGNFVVIEHQGGIRSAYSHLSDGSVPVDTEQVVSSDVIGIVGDTGSSYGNHLHLAIIDTEMSAYLNPLSVLPPQENLLAPVVRRVFLRIEQGELLEIRGDQAVRGRRIVPPAQIEVLAEIYDLREKTDFIWKVAPHSILVYGNGIELNEISFSSLREEGGRLVLSDTGRSFAETYYSLWVYRLSSMNLTRGELHVQIMVDDYYANETSQEVFLTVRD